MKKNLVVLTGIALFVAVLVAFGCNRDSKPKAEQGGGVPTATAVDTTKVDIYLKAVVIDENMHLEMYEERKSGCPVIDGLLTVVYPGYTIKWKKAADSNIDKIINIRTVGGDGTFFGAVPEPEAEDRSSFKLDIPKNAPFNTLVKYEITFTVGDDTTTIDPYLKIPPELK